MTCCTNQGTFRIKAYSHTWPDLSSYRFYNLKQEWQIRSHYKRNISSSQFLLYLKLYSYPEIFPRKFQQRWHALQGKRLRITCYSVRLHTERNHNVPQQQDIYMYGVQNSSVFSSTHLQHEYTVQARKNDKKRILECMGFGCHILDAMFLQGVSQSNTETMSWLSSTFG